MAFDRRVDLSSTMIKNLDFRFYYVWQHLNLERKIFICDIQINYLSHMRREYIEDHTRCH